MSEILDKLLREGRSIRDLVKKPIVEKKEEPRPTIPSLPERPSILNGRKSEPEQVTEEVIAEEKPVVINKLRIMEDSKIWGFLHSFLGQSPHPKYSQLVALSDSIAVPVEKSIQVLMDNMKSSMGNGTERPAKIEEDVVVPSGLALPILECELKEDGGSDAPAVEQAPRTAIQKLQDKEMKKTAQAPQNSSSAQWD